MNLTCKEHLQALRLGDTTPISQKVFHITTKFAFEEFFEGAILAKSFIGICQETYVQNREHVFCLLDGRGPHDDDEILLSLRTQL